MKKVFSIILCVAMIFACTAMVFAAEDHNVMLTTVAAPLTALPLTAVGDPLIIAPQGTAKTMTLPGENPINLDYSKLEKFKDVDASAWYADGLAWCVGNGLLNGKSETKMAPFDKITRGEIVTMLWRVEGEPVVNFAMNFSDVKGDEYYGEAVRWAAAEKVVNGYEDGTFKPTKTITREELVQIIYNYAKLKGNGFTGSWMFLLDYPDAANVGDWANEAMHWCVMKEIITGSDGKLLPQGLASRAEAATMFMRLNPEVAGQEAPIVPIFGGFQQYLEQTELDLTKIPEEAKNAINLLNMSIDGAKRTPLVYLGSQVVAGTNYKFICRIEPLVKNGPAAKLAVVTIYEDLSKNVTILNEEEITDEMFATDGSIKFPEAGLVGAFGTEDIAGGFESVEYGTAGSTEKYGLEAKAKEAFDTATKGLAGVGYRPLMLLSTQVVAGTNYRLICVATRVTAQPAKALCLVQVYGALDGTAEFKVIGNCNF